MGGVEETSLMDAEETFPMVVAEPETRGTPSLSRTSMQDLPSSY